MIRGVTGCKEKPGLLLADKLLSASLAIGQLVFADRALGCK